MLRLKFPHVWRGNRYNIFPLSKTATIRYRVSQKYATNCSDIYFRATFYSSSHRIERHFSIHSKRDEDSSSNNQSPKTGDLNSETVSSQKEREKIEALQTQAQMQSFRNQIQSIPNLITTARILSTPFICHQILTGQYTVAIIGCAAVGFSDWLDGYIAKNYGSTTVLGSYLDPLADKIVLTSLSVSLAYVGILPLWTAGLWIGRDVFLIGGCYYAAALAAKGRGHNVIDPGRTPLRIQPTALSKLNTVLQFGTIGVALALGLELEPGTIAIGIETEYFSLPLDRIVEGMCWMTAFTTVGSGISYLDGASMKASGNKNDSVKSAESKDRGSTSISKKL